MHKSDIFSIIVVSCAAFLNIAEAQAEEWGTLSGRFVFGGPAPTREPLELNKDIAFCGMKKPLDQELIVNEKNRGLKNVVLWLEPKTGDASIPVHPSYEKTAKDKVKFDNKDCLFQPHICTLRTTQTLVIGNQDKINHNVAVFFFGNDPFNENVPTGDTVEKQLTIAEKIPAKVSCPIHAWMIGYMIVKDHPYVAVTDEDGKFELKNLPAGEWTLRAWHEKPGYIKTSTIQSEPQTWASGKIPISVKPGNTAWGDIEVSPELFTK